MTYALGKLSRSRLDGVHPDLILIVEKALAGSPVDFMVLEGLRSKARQQQLYDQGRKTPGPKVTWTMNSKHRIQADGYGHAVDLGPWVDGKVDWTAGKHFDQIATAMFAAAQEVGRAIRWGADWDKDGKPRERGESDSPHFELA